MGYDSRANLFVGIKAEEAVERTTAVESVTKYDEDTGEPHQQEVSKSKVTFFGIEIAELDDRGCFIEEELEGFATELEVCSPNPEANEELIGLSLGRLGTGEKSSTAEITLAAINDKLAEVKIMLVGLGYKGPEPRVFLVFEESF